MLRECVPFSHSENSCTLHVITSSGFRGSVSRNILRKAGLKSQLSFDLPSWSSV